MLSILQEILCVLQALATYVLVAIVWAFNAVIAAFGAFMAAILALLPDFPDAPSSPPSGVLGWLTWVVPLGPLVAGLALFVTCWALFLVIRIPLKWIKAL